MQPYLTIFVVLSIAILRWILNRTGNKKSHIKARESGIITMKYPNGDYITVVIGALCFMICCVLIIFGLTLQFVSIFIFSFLLSFSIWAAYVFWRKVKWSIQFELGERQFTYTSINLKKYQISFDELDSFDVIGERVQFIWKGKKFRFNRNVIQYNEFVSGVYDLYNKDIEEFMIKEHVE
jgi:hypothetical protein